jgi:hypothetical protein
VGRARASLVERRARASAPPEDFYYGLRGGVLRAASLRYREAVADLLWVRAVLYFGLRGEVRQPPLHIDRHLEAVIGLDPHFERAYSTAAALTQYRPGDRRETLARAIRFLERGTERFPTHWRFPFFIGAYYLEMPARDPAEAARLRRLAADWVQRAVLLGAGRGAPDWLPNLAATLLTEAGQREMALRYLEESLLTVLDEATRAQVRAKIAQLRDRVEADRVAREAERFLHVWRRNYAYVPGDLFVFLGERPATAPFDLAAVIAGVAGGTRESRTAPRP